MSTNNQFQCELFNLPGEIRRCIHDFAIEIPSEVDLCSIYNDLEADRGEPRVKRLSPEPYSNTFAATGHRAYQETRHLYYQTPIFLAEDPLSIVPSPLKALEVFVTDTRPENISFIVDLAGNELWTKNFPNLSPFSGLKSLSTRYSSSDPAVTRNDVHPRRWIFRRLVARARHLKNLEMIMVMTDGEKSLYDFARKPLGLDYTPGWAYDVQFKRGSPGLTVIECLERAHGPHWEERAWQRRAEPKEIDDDVFADCMARFRAEVEPEPEH